MPAALNPDGQGMPLYCAKSRQARLCCRRLGQARLRQPAGSGGARRADQAGVRLSPAGLMVTVPAPLTVTDCASADQVSALPPVAASNMPA